VQCGGKAHPNFRVDSPDLYGSYILRAKGASGNWSVCKRVHCQLAWLDVIHGPLTDLVRRCADDGIHKHAITEA